MGTIKVVLAEDQALMRDAVALVFEETEDMELVGAVADGRDLLPLLKRVEADVILLDVQLPGLDGLGCSHPRHYGKEYRGGFADSPG